MVKYARCRKQDARTESKSACSKGGILCVGEARRPGVITASESVISRYFELRQTFKTSTPIVKL